MVRTRADGRGIVRWRVLAAAGAALVAAPAVAACSSESGNQVTVYSAPEQNFQTVVDNCNKAANGKYEIVYRKLPRGADGQREQLVRRLAAGDSDLDVLGLDVTWTAEFAEAGWIEEWTGADKAEIEDGTLKGPLDTATYNGKLYAAPKNTNVQLLWYDKTVTPKPPETWAEMIDMAKRLKSEGRPYQIVFTGAQYEGLVVTYNSLVSSAGGEILSADGKKVVLDEGALKALEILKEATDSGITHPSLTVSQEGETQHQFEDKGSEAAFELNWPFVYPAMKDGNPDRFKNLEWTTYPGIDGPGKSTIGGNNFAVSALSSKKPQAFEAAKCLRNAENQRFSAINDGVPPTIESVYAGDDKEFVDAYPMWETILDELQDPAVRPQTVVYQNLSTITSKLLSPPAEIDPQDTIEELRDGLQKALESKGVLP